jgi:hypothetical protein
MAPTPKKGRCLARGESPSEIKSISRFDNGSFDNGSAAIVDKLMRMQTALENAGVVFFLQRITPEAQVKTPG